MKHLSLSILATLLLTLGHGSSNTFNLIPMTHSWKFRQDGVALPAAWKTAGYDDSGWSNGRALLYVENAALPAPKNTPLSLTNSSGQHTMTYYFRTVFTLTNTANVSFIMSNVLDDGAVFYVNGVEMLRVRMPGGLIDNGTGAADTVSDAVMEGPVFVMPTNLIAGTNVLAVEVHQVNATSSDVVFGCSIEGTTESPYVSITPPAAVVAAGTNAMFQALATGLPAFTYEWRFARALPGMDDVFNGVGKITAGGDTGLSTFFLTREWTAIVSLTRDVQLFNTVIAARTYGSGKAVVFGHNGFLSSPDLDNVRFWTNLATWSGATGQRRVAASSGHGESSTVQIRSSLGSAGLGTTVITSPITTAKLTNVAVLLVNGTGFDLAYTTNEIEAVRQFVEAGGALWVAGEGWVWDSYHPGQGLEAWSLTKLVAPYDIKWTLASAYKALLLYPTLYTTLVAETNAVLNQSNVSSAAAGRYTVVASNPYGQRSATATLNVLQPVAIVAGPVNLTVGPGGTANLSVQASGDALRYQWLLNGVALSGSTNSTLILSNVGAMSVGSYTVTVSNQVSSVTSAPAVLALLGLDMLPGLTLTGPVGTQFQIDFADGLLGSTNWITLTNFTLLQPVYRLVDWDALGKPKRFYRAAVLP